MHMRHVRLFLAAALSILAVGAPMVPLPAWVGPTAIVAAALMLVMWVVLQYRRRAAPDLALSDDQRDAIAQIKQAGEIETAVQQVQLWKRDASREDAVRIVRDL